MNYFITKNRAACVIMQVDLLIMQVDLVQNVLYKCQKLCIVNTCNTSTYVLSIHAFMSFQ